MIKMSLVLFYQHNCSGIMSKEKHGGILPREGEKKKAFFNNELLDFFQQRLRSLQESRDFVIKWKDCDPVSLRALYLASLQNATCNTKILVTGCVMGLVSIIAGYAAAVISKEPLSAVTQATISFAQWLQIPRQSFLVMCRRCVIF